MKSLFISLFTSALFINIHSFAQEAAETAVETPNPHSIWNSHELFQPLGLAMLLIIIFLFIAILVMSNVINISSKYTLEKMRKKRKNHIVPLIIFALMLLPATVFAQATGESAPKLIGGLAPFTFYILLIIIVIEILAIIVISKGFNRLLDAEGYEDSNAAKSAKHQTWWQNMLGIEHNDERDLKRSPLGWKVALGAFGLLALFIIFNFLVTDSKNNKASDEIAVVDSADAVEEIDENNVPLTTDAVELEEGKTIYIEKCAACHLADGGGSVGPNLTDEFWIHGCTVSDIFKTIKHGVPDKGMISWKDQLTPSEMAHIASFIVTLKGTKPETPKEAQGDKCTASETTPATPVDGADSATTITDSAITMVF